ncbi:putative bifunctional diguanylate cyclase/phosphodiesterase [Rheinheimera texasensis]|jgi:diguanylate cyclase (GGDEF)-like protein|uniref:putative bifunctional diguanylate cyclase/phosphodiesterase n=1 Tax=Rheinheimera texasensis TaxID=306205 RepID=UPI0004E164B0|nr:bifunctional diguanylate cyclase/phosphodiesterase [Rheinheimera texasensis]
MPNQDLTLQGTLDVLYNNLKTGLIGTGVAATASCLLLFQYSQNTAIGIWWLLMIGVLSWRGYDLRCWNSLKTKREKYQPQIFRRFATLAIATAMLWSLFSLWFGIGSDSEQLIIILATLAAIAAGVTNALSSNKTLIISYITLCLLPFGLWFLWQGGDQIIFGYLGIIFTGLLSFSARNSYLFTLESIRLRREHEHLLANLETEVLMRTKELSYLSDIESLTGLYNRRRFIEIAVELTEVSRRNQLKLALVMIDLVGLKSINDGLGHEIGDEFLREIAERLRLLTHEPAICCRWGGDEFLIAIPITDEALYHFVEQVQQSISQPFRLQENALRLSANIGVSLYPDHGQDISQLINLADLALYGNIEKAGKQGFTVYDSQIAGKYRRKSMLRTRLEQAISQQELRLVYQPIIQLNATQQNYYEVLLRWTLDGTPVAPDEFIPLAEQSGLINPIGYWVLEQACLTISHSIKLGKPLQLAVNVSALQFQQNEFVPDLLALLDKHQIPANLLQIEITESVFTVDKKILIDKTNQLRDAGIAIAIDDFGTGYSSLSVINELQVNKVKIDKAFIDKIDDGGMPVLRAIASMSQSMGWEIVAEGVETAAQVEVLSKLNIHYMQGYYFSKPVEYSSLFQN